ncbi:MAG TPA: HPP family protein, partial [Thermodesulfobacteriota bacterium]|nr:HPP family protein [Thermodesulfobacteriota bacterium]
MAKDKKRESLKPIEGANRSLRHRPTLREEIVLALLPTVTVLIVFGFVEVFSQQRLLFASLASSAFLIYLDPQHGTNSIRTLVISQMSAAVVGLVIYIIFGPGYLSGGSSML